MARIVWQVLIIRASYPKLAHVPVLSERFHGELDILVGTVFYSLQIFESVLLKIAL